VPVLVPLPTRNGEKGEVVGFFTSETTVERSGDFVGPEGVTNDSTGTPAANKATRAIGSNEPFIMDFIIDL
jgi:hypothetical protein